MGFGTYYVHETYFSHETFDSIYRVKTAIEEEQKIVDMLKSEINSLAVMTEPKKFFNCDDCDDLVGLVTNKMDTLLSDYEESMIRLYRLKDLEYNWDKCHTEINGKVVGRYPSDENPYYLYGDFISTDNDLKEDNESSDTE